MYNLIAFVILISSFITFIPIRQVSFPIAPITLGAGLVSLLFLNTKLNIFVKLLVCYSYLNIFFSVSPQVSLTAFMGVLGCVIFYWLITKLTINEYMRNYKIFPLLLLFQIFWIIMFAINKNFALQKLPEVTENFLGTIGNPMMLGSYLAVLTAPLMMYKKWLVIPLLIVLVLAKSTTGFIAVLTGLVFYLSIKQPKFTAMLIIVFLTLTFLHIVYDDAFMFKNGMSNRLPIWKRGFDIYISQTIKGNRPQLLTGFGYGTWKTTFPDCSKDITKVIVGKDTIQHTAWMRSHNDYLQLLYEGGLIGLMLFMGFVGHIIHKFIRSTKTDELLLITTGLVIVSVNMIGAFPTKMIQCVPIIIFLLGGVEIFYEANHHNTNLMFGKRLCHRAS